MALQGQRNFVGILREVNDGVLKLEVDGKMLDLELNNLEKARLGSQIVIIRERLAGGNMTREVLLLVDALAREKNVEKDIVFIALELALASATKKRFHEDADVRVSIDPQTGDYQSLRRWQVVADDAVEEPARQISLERSIAAQS